jgi:hypothetical protein
VSHFSDIKRLHWVRNALLLPFGSSLIRSSIFNILFNHFKLRSLAWHDFYTFSVLTSLLVYSKKILDRDIQITITPLSDFYFQKTIRQILGLHCRSVLLSFFPLREVFAFFDSSLEISLFTVA